MRRGGKGRGKGGRGEEGRGGEWRGEEGERLTYKQHHKLSVHISHMQVT